MNRNINSKICIIRVKHMQSYLVIYYYYHKNIISAIIFKNISFCFVLGKCESNFFWNYYLCFYTVDTYRQVWVASCNGLYIFNGSTWYFTPHLKKKLFFYIYQQLPYAIVHAYILLPRHQIQQYIWIHTPSR